MPEPCTMRSLPVSPNDSTILQKGYLSRHKKWSLGKIPLEMSFLCPLSAKDDLKKELAKKADSGSNPFTFLTSFIK